METAEERKTTTKKVNRGDAFTLRIRCTLLTELLGTLDEGKYTGYGQWRNAGYGRFIYEVQG